MYFIYVKKYISMKKKYVKSVQQITTNFSQFMSTKANNWKKKSSKSPGMIIPYFTNEGMHISTQKMKGCGI